MATKKVLIAHQSTIPHYRVDFYNELEAARPSSWSFEVVFDLSELKKKRFFEETVDINQFTFPILDVRTFSIKFSEKVFNYQNFWRRAAKYDLIVVGSALSNLTYPLCRIHQLTGSRFAIWGHGRDHSVVKPQGFKYLLEKLRSGLAYSADAFFAYTPNVKIYLESRGVSPKNIFVLNNTIDILKQRSFFYKLHPYKTLIKQELALQGKKVLLFIGRFTKNKRISFLLEAFAILAEKNPDFHLILVGNGSQAYQNKELRQVTFLEGITDVNRLALLYVASDAFTFPGDVGLGPLQALCYDLPVITMDSPTHMPEFSYLSSRNAIILPVSSTPAAYAQAISELFNNTDHFHQLKSDIWESINHLTIKQMARNFITGVNMILSLQ